jgi:hypothetical protein
MYQGAVDQTFKNGGPSSLSKRLAFFLSLLTLGLAVLVGMPALAQGGDGSMQGTITDKTGALIPNAKITVTNIDTAVAIVRSTNKSGDFTVSPLQAGHYYVTVTAKGFETLVQEQVTVDALQTVGLNLKMSVGSESQTITITDAPPMLDTQDASMGGTIENELYTELPLSMGGAPRDPTSFAFLMPGVQEGDGNTGVFGGSGQEFLNQTYIDGMPVSTISKQGDPTTVSSAVSVDAVDQFQVKTNGASVAFGGAGVTNYTLKTGGDKLHGTIFDYVRNTAFDSWGYFSKTPGANGYARKPGEHQNSYGGSLGGPIIKGKLFYFFTYEGFHYTKISNTPQYLTVPTLQERKGDFTDAFGTGNATMAATTGIFDPTEGNAVRSQFQGLLNGVPTFNVIPQGLISPISLAMAAALPVPTNQSTVNNYLAGLPLQQDDYRLDGRLDYTISARNKLSIVGVGGLNGSNTIPRYSSQTQLPLPYAGAAFVSAKTATGVITHTFVATQRLINTFKYGYTRTWGQSFSPTKGGPFSAANEGILNTPPGNASVSAPGVTFSSGGPNAQASPSGFAGNVDSGPQATNNYTIIDNLLYVKGRHNLTFGIQVQWLETNAASYAGFSGPTALTYSSNSTENLAFNASTNVLTGGSAYASFLVGAVYAANVRTQTISDVGGRYRPIAPYVQDSWRIRPNVTINLGLRYDYLQPYREVHDRFAFINPDLTNPVVGIPGVIQFGGFGAGPSSLFTPYVCQCHTPIHPYNKNFEPQLAVAWSVHRDTVVRANFGVITTHAGGTGGHGNATAGPGNNSEFAYTNVWQGNGSTDQPVFFLNPNIQGSPNNGKFAPGLPGGQADFSSLPVFTSAAANFNPLSTTGNYLIGGTSAGPNSPFPCANVSSNNCNSSTQNYVDLYYGGRGPQFVNYNFGIEQMINKQAVLSINYVGSQTHFLPGGSGRGYATNSIPADVAYYLATLTGPDIPIPTGQTVDNVLSKTWNTDPKTGLTNGERNAIVSVAPKLSPINGPFLGYGGNGATVARAVSGFPQFGNLSDIWGATGNSNYNALQISIIQRPWHNLSGFVNFTWSKSIDDVGIHRTQYPVGPNVGNFNGYKKASGVDRSLGRFDQRHAFNATWNYLSPIGRGQQFFATSRVATWLGGGWSLSGIYKIREGSPLQITTNTATDGSCITSANAYQGTCLPDYNPNFIGTNPRINGKWGRGPGANASNVQTIGYINPAAFQCPDNVANCGSYKLGNVARSAPYGLTGPGYWDVDLGIRRTFLMHESSALKLTFQLEADVINVTNSTFFSLAGGNSGWGVCPPNVTNTTQCSALAFGTVGGQNGAVPPRDWQFAGRFRF